MDDITPLDRACQILGNASALARALRIKPPSVAEWRARNRVPAERCLAIERATNGRVTKHELRPDVFGPAPDADAVELTARQSMNVNQTGPEQRAA